MLSNRLILIIVLIGVVFIICMVLIHLFCTGRRKPFSGRPARRPRPRTDWDADGTTDDGYAEKYFQ